MYCSNNDINFVTLNKKSLCFNKNECVIKYGKYIPNINEINYFPQYDNDFRIIFNKSHKHKWKLRVRYCYISNFYNKKYAKGCIIILTYNNYSYICDIATRKYKEISNNTDIYLAQFISENYIICCGNNINIMFYNMNIETKSYFPFDPLNSIKSNIIEIIPLIMCSTDRTNVKGKFIVVYAKNKISIYNAAKNINELDIFTNTCKQICIFKPVYDENNNLNYSTSKIICNMFINSTLITIYDIYGNIKIKIPFMSAHIIKFYSMEFNLVNSNAQYIICVSNNNNNDGSYIGIYDINDKSIVFTSININIKDIVMIDNEQILIISKNIYNITC